MPDEKRWDGKGMSKTKPDFHGIPEKTLLGGLKIMNLKKTYVVIAALALSMGFGGYHKSSEALAKDSTTSPYLQMAGNSVEQPVAPERNPSGDIPDSQAFVKYASPRGGYELDVPEGWARRTRGGDVIFTSKLDGLSVTITDAGKMPDAQSVRKNQVKQLKKTGRAVVIKSIKDIRFKSGPAVRVVYESNSEPNSVTNKQVRLEDNSYFYYRNGKVAELRLWAPLGADNIDQWNRVSSSFRWRKYESS